MLFQGFRAVQRGRKLLGNRVHAVGLDPGPGGPAVLAGVSGGLHFCGVCGTFVSVRAGKPPSATGVLSPITTLIRPLGSLGSDPTLVVVSTPDLWIACRSGLHGLWGSSGALLEIRAIPDRLLRPLTQNGHGIPATESWGIVDNALVRLLSRARRGARRRRWLVRRTMA